MITSLGYSDFITFYYTKKPAEMKQLNASKMVRKEHFTSCQTNQIYKVLLMSEIHIFHGFYFDIATIVIAF